HNDLEVMTEYIIYLVGRNIGARVADARIAMYQGRVRFLSRYFLDPAREELVHGLQLFEQLFDAPTMKRIARDEASEQNTFTLQAIRDAFGAHYLEYGATVQQDLYEALVDMVVHDAIIGVQDRHHENWGVIVHRGREEPGPRFSPLYDSARGLFCNETDVELVAKDDRWLRNYIGRSKPLMGWQGLAPAPGRKYLRHHELVAAVFRDAPEMRGRIRARLDAYDWQSLRDVLRTRVPMCSPMRRSLVNRLLRGRIKRINQAIATACGA
ncbi:MAG TPA: hypothetical protein VJ837_00050, partial [Candidatus Paceibacterota bacterium]|nr:hypothetical protein [Candidatus Paceibacterota bacterium]